MSAGKHPRRQARDMKADPAVRGREDARRCPEDGKTCRDVHCTDGWCLNASFNDYLRKHPEFADEGDERTDHAE